MKTMAATALSTAFIALLAIPQGAASAGQEQNIAPEGVIEGRVTRPGAMDGIADVQIILQGPTPSLETWLDGVYSPKQELTPDMRENITRMIEDLLRGGDNYANAVATLVMRRESSLLGSPLPRIPFFRNQLVPVPPQRTATSDPDGRFSFRNLPPGRYWVRAERVGYLGPPPKGETKLTDGDEEIVILTETQTTSDLTFHLTAEGVIGGRVRDPQDRPLPNYAVAAYQISYRGGRPVLGTSKSTTTDDRGEYRLFWLPPGAYVVAAQPPPTGATPSRAAFVETFHSGERDLRLTPPITVGEGAVIDGIDIRVRADARRTISGRIVTPFVDVKGQPITPSSKMYLATPGSNAPGNQCSSLCFKEFQNVAPTKTGGLFEIRNVLPGSYELWASAEDGSRMGQVMNSVIGGVFGSEAWGHTHVEVGDRDVENVPIAIKPNVALKVRVTLDNGDPSQGLIPDNIPFIPFNLVPRDRPNSSWHPSGTNMADGFQFENVPQGRYSLDVVLSRAYVADIRQNGVSVYDEGFEVTGAPAGVEVIMRTDGGTAQGTVHDNDGHPAPGTVVLLPPQSRRVNPHLYKTMQTQDGNFLFRDIPPGEYKVVAWEFGSVPSEAWLNADIMADFEPRGKTITVTAGAPTAVDLTIISKDH